MSISTFRVYYEDTDAGGVVYHANYLKFCERARSDHIFNKGTSPQRGENHFVIVDMHAKFKAPARLGDEITVSMEPLKVGNVSIVLYQEVKKDERVLFTLEATFALTNAKGRPMKLDAGDKALFS